MKVLLEEIGDRAAAHQVVLEQFPIILGRGEVADVRLDDRWVSRRHCRIERAGEAILVRDLGSRHGTLVNRSHIDSAVLMPGDELTVGMTTFAIRYRTMDSAGTPPDTVPSLAGP